MPNTDALMQVYQNRPDLQQVYNPDGTKKNPNDNNPPTLQDWAVMFGAKEEPTLADFAPQQFDPTKWGIPIELWNQASPSQKAFFEAASGYVQSQTDSGSSAVAVDSDTYNKALNIAMTDPTLVQKYGDSAKLGMSDLQFNLGQIDTNYKVAQAQQNLELEKQRKDLAEAEAQAGRAYSGYRKQAENLLSAQQAGIIQSTKSQLQQNVQNIGRAYEAQFGSNAMRTFNQQQPITAGGVNYAPIGDLTGTNVTSQKQEAQANIPLYLSNPLKGK